MEKMEEKNVNKRKKRTIMERKRRNLPEALGQEGTKHVSRKPGPNVKFLIIHNSFFGF
jgi:hypothetical protein